MDTPSFIAAVFEISPEGFFEKTFIFASATTEGVLSMRLLEFIVSAQRITADPECTFDNIVAGTEGYLQAQFTFSSEWDNCVKAASFWRGEKEYSVILRNDTCVIPAEVLTGPTFRVSVTGQSKEYVITTNRLLVRQEVYR